MWCPSCGAEYRPGFTHCPDCGVDLVAERPPEPEPAAGVVAGIVDPDLGPSPVEVFVGPVIEAELMRAVLEGSGIACAASGSGMQGAYPGLFPHRIAVAGEDAERALEVIAAARRGELDLEAFDEDDDAPDGGT
jgi:putative signal transducing protein